MVAFTKRIADTIKSAITMQYFVEYTSYFCITHTIYMAELETLPERIGLSRFKHNLDAG